MGSWVLIVHLLVNPGNVQDNRQSLWMQEFGTQQHCDQVSTWLKLNMSGSYRTACFPKGDSPRE